MTRAHASTSRTASGAEIRPFTLAIDASELDQLKDRLRTARIAPDEIAGAGWSQGVPAAYLNDLVGYWRDEYDWRQQEAVFNRYPQYTTTIDGQNIYFLHVRSAEPDAMPLLITHGWPGSVVEYLHLIDQLVDPAAHGGDPADAFHVVIPALPGFGFSGPTREPWPTERTAAAWAELMRRLDYDRYAAHGGDFGAAVSRQLGVIDEEHVIGLHLTDLFSATLSSEEADANDPEEQRAVQAARRFEYELSGYTWIQATRPHTLAHALNDSPVGQLAWIVEKFKDWTDSTDTPEGAVDRDALLTNVMVYWLTQTAYSSARHYADNAAGWGAEEPDCKVPVAVAVAPRNIAVPIRRIGERKNSIVRWTKFERGGHFAAMEIPDLLLADLREALRPLRTR